MNFNQILIDEKMTYLLNYDICVDKITHRNSVDVIFRDKRLKWHLEELSLPDEIYSNLCVLDILME
jgi:hypothetical protein